MYGGSGSSAEAICGGCGKITECGDPPPEQEALIVSLLYKPDAQARESPQAAVDPSLARRACMGSLLAFRNVTIKAEQENLDTDRIAP